MNTRCTVAVTVNNEIVARFALAEDAIFFARTAVEQGMFATAHVSTKDNEYDFA